jgi:hypothetical protein
LSHARFTRIIVRERRVRAGELRRAAADAPRVRAFGHVRGALPAPPATGGVASRSPALGTIFLDEIGDTSLEFQSKLLRVLQDREYQPVGSEKTERTEARVITATHRDLEAMIAEGSFREDLYYRLRVIEIALPRFASAPATFRCSPAARRARVSRDGLRPGRDFRRGPRRAERASLARQRARAGKLSRTRDRARPRRRDSPRPSDVGAAMGARESTFGSLIDAERDHVARVLRQLDVRRRVRRNTRRVASEAHRLLKKA